MLFLSLSLPQTQIRDDIFVAGDYCCVFNSLRYLRSLHTESMSLAYETLAVLFKPVIYCQ